MREFSLPGRLILLPGVGMTPDAFAPQRKAFGDGLVTPDWITPEPRETVTRYAQRWGGSIAETLGDDGRPVFLGGVSFGGTLALAMAENLTPRPAAVFLIGAARHADGLSGWAEGLAKLAAKLSPAALKKASRVGLFPLGLVDGLDDAGIKLFTKMVNDLNPDVLHWTVASVADWVAAASPDHPASGDARAGSPGGGQPPIFQIHGRDDRYYPLSKQHPDEVVDHGNHLIHLNHARTVNRWLFDHTMRIAGYDLDATPRVEDPRVTVSREMQRSA